MEISQFDGSASKTKRPLPKAGAQAARLIHIVDLGVQVRKAFQGNERPPIRTLWFNFELPNDKADFKNKGVLEPHRIAMKPLPASNHEKSGLSNLLRTLDPDNKINGVLDNLLDKPLIVNVLHNKVAQADGAVVTYANVGTITPAPEGYPVPNLSDKAFVFDFNNPTPETYAKLPEFIKTKIKSALNYAGSKVEQMVNSIDVVKEEKTTGQPY